MMLENKMRFSVFVHVYPCKCARHCSVVRRLSRADTSMQRPLCESKFLLFVSPVGRYRRELLLVLASGCVKRYEAVEILSVSCCATCDFPAEESGS